MVLGREAVATERRPLVPADLALELEAAERCPLFDQFLRVQAADPEVVPPGGLVFATVVIEEISQQASSLRLVFRNSGEQPSDEVGDPRRGLGLRRFRGDFDRWAIAGTLQVDEVSAQVLEPFVESEGGQAVLAVVPPDHFPVRRLHAATEIQCGIRPGARPVRFVERLFPEEAVERFHQLERVALDRRHEALTNHLEEIHENLAPQQPVHRVLAGRVAAHQPFQRAGFVAPVVVDVEIGKALPPLGDHVHERLEPASLRVAVEGPPVLVAAVTVHETEEVLEPAVRSRPGALDVEEQISLGRLGEREQSASVFRRPDEFPKRLSPLTPGELSVRLPVDALERGRRHSLERRLQG